MSAEKRVCIIMRKGFKCCECSSDDSFVLHFVCNIPEGLSQHGGIPRQVAELLVDIDADFVFDDSSTVHHWDKNFMALSCIPGYGVLPSIRPGVGHEVNE